MNAIKLLILDVDGVLTDGKIYITPDGEEGKMFHTQDGCGLVQLQRTGVIVAIISGRNSQAAAHRMSELGLTHVYLGCRNKTHAFEKILADTGLSEDQCAYVGDDIPDLCVMERVKHKVAVANATPPVLAIADWVTQRRGGDGAVREVTDWIMNEAQ